ncbi:PAS sensor protein [Gemmatirosa kalamazoonensis]|uniref:histidine kinase n=1 Tax=Gemmatirosa kalamazoonensis TaxID=861299 RepID=W0RG60_9BACT|nr:PAS domain-containing sensor histidine kinase [Gemmatirosa kalamazoonensis]AHG89310.1 PAS sensor protein [Gemmatirosa kalamazoonensis]
MPAPPTAPLDTPDPDPSGSDAGATARDRFDAVSRASPVGIFHADLNGTVTYVNPRLQAIAGLGEDDLRGRRWLRFVHPDDVPTLLRGWTAANAARREYEHEFRALLPDGRVRWLHGRSAVVCDAAGTPVQTVGTVEDVTARHVAVEKMRGLLAISEALARALGAGDVVRAVAEHAVPVVGARSAIVMLLSEDAEALELVGEEGTGAESADWRRVPLTMHVPAADAMRDGGPVTLASPDEMAARYPHVAHVWQALGARALATFALEAEGRRFGAIAFRFPHPRVFRDSELAFLRAVVNQCAVSLERARLFDEARAAREAAFEASRAKSEFLARMSHELRTPLNAIAGHLQLIEMGLHGPVTTAQHDALARVGRAQRHLLGLINDVLNFTRLESGRVEYQLTPLRVSDVLLDVQPMVEPQLAAKRLAFDVQLPEDDGSPPLLVWGDREKLVQVLLNLLTNAAKFTPEGGSVALRLGPSDGAPDRATITVRDTGVGVPRDRLEAIFDPFVQVNASLTREHQGSGLGLAISRDLARGMGGDITVESALGSGSTFTVHLRRSVLDDGTTTDRRSHSTRRHGHERRSGVDRRQQD